MNILVRVETEGQIHWIYEEHLQAALEALKFKPFNPPGYSYTFWKWKHTGHLARGGGSVQTWGDCYSVREAEERIQQLYAHHHGSVRFRGL